MYRYAPVVAVKATRKRVGSAQTTASCVRGCKLRPVNRQLKRHVPGITYPCYIWLATKMRRFLTWSTGKSRPLQRMQRIRGRGWVDLVPLILKGGGKTFRRIKITCELSGPDPIRTTSNPCTHYRLAARSCARLPCRPFPPVFFLTDGTVLVRKNRGGSTGC